MKTPHQIQVLAMLAEIGQHLQRIEEKLNQLNPAKPVWLQPQDVCFQLNISKRTLESYREKGHLAFSRIGGKVFYSQADIEDTLNHHLVSGYRFQVSGFRFQVSGFRFQVNFK